MEGERSRFYSDKGIRRPLSADEKSLIREVVRLDGEKPGEFYVKAMSMLGLPVRHELWILAGETLLGSADDSIHRLVKLYGLSPREARAVHLFCTAFPSTIRSVIRSKNVYSWLNETETEEDPMHEL